MRDWRHPRPASGRSANAPAAPHFTHASVGDFRIICDNFAGGSRSTRNRLAPYCLFTDPLLARVGLSETEAHRRGIAARVARLPTSAVLRTATTDETKGFMKALVGADGRILGFTMIGSEAGEVMTAVQTAMLAGLLYQQLRGRHCASDNGRRSRSAPVERPAFRVKCSSPARARKKGRWIFGRSALDRPAFRAATSS
jgi:hypothetical protein